MTIEGTFASEAPRSPFLSIVVLTLNEERNIASCLAAVSRQADRDFEVIVIDAASTDRTVEIAQNESAAFPVPLRVVRSPRRLPIGEARNLGVQESKGRFVAFVSADAEIETDWTQRVHNSSANYDMVFGRQVHTPRTWTVAATVRGLRYNFPRKGATRPQQYASNVAAAYRRELLLRYPFDEESNAAEDLLIAHHAVHGGFRILYDADLVVFHHDVTTAKEELRKNVREGSGWGEYVSELGIAYPHLAWGLLLVFALALVPISFDWGLLLLVVVLWLPTVRRLWRYHTPVPWRPLVGAVVVSPFFDLAFLGNYVKGLMRAARRSEDA
jgi:glycosyltransferase involved in cell wall biosynthesis